MTALADELRVVLGLAGKATAGPWKVSRHDAQTVHTNDDFGVCTSFYASGESGREQDEATSALIAAAVNFVRSPELAEALREREALRGLLDAATCPNVKIGCDGEQYPDHDNYGNVVGVQCQWCYERNALSAASGGGNG